MGMAGCALACATMSCSSSRLSLRGTPRSERPLGCKAAKPPRSWAYHQSSSVRTATDWLEPSAPATAEDEATVSRAILSGTCWANSSWTLLIRLKRAKATASARLFEDVEFMRATVRPDRRREKQTLVWDLQPDPRVGKRPGSICCLRQTQAAVIPQQREVATLSQEPQNGGQCFFGQAHLFPQVRRLGNHARNQL